MRVLSINTWHSYGGAARIARGLHEAINGMGHLSTFVSMETGAAAPRHVCLFKGKLEFKLSRLLNKLDQLASTQYWHEPFSRRILSMPEYKGCDIVHCHNLHCGFFNPSLLETFKNDGKKIVMTLHDEWWLTGHCAITYGCEGFKTGCRACPHLDFYPELAFDRAGRLFERKRALLHKLSPCITAPSAWLLNQAKTSGATDGLDLCKIPNFYDKTAFFPERNPERRSRTLLSVVNNADDKAKNFRLACKAVKLANQRLPDSRRWRLAIAGNCSEEFMRLCEGIPLEPLGYIKDSQKLRSAYNSASAFLISSRSEVCPVSILESLACGTPVIASRVGGIPETLDASNGILFESDDLDGLADRLVSFDSDSFDRDKIAETAKIFSSKNIIKSYISLLSSVLGKRAGE